MRSGWLGMHFLGPIVVLAVVLPPGVNLYPRLSSLSSLLPFAAYCWVRACLWWGYAWDVSSLCGVYVRVFASLSALCALVCSFAFVAPFCLFRRYLSGGSSCSVPLVCLPFLSLLSVSWPRAALSWDSLDPWGINY